VAIWGLTFDPNAAARGTQADLPGEAFTANVDTPALPQNVPANSATSVFAFTRLITSTSNSATFKSGRTQSEVIKPPALDRDQFMQNWNSQPYNLGLKGVSIPEGDLLDPTDPTKGFKHISVEDTPFMVAATKPYTTSLGGNRYSNYIVKINLNTTFQTVLDYRASNPRLGPGLWLAVAKMDFKITGDAVFKDNEAIHTANYYASPTSWDVNDLSPTPSSFKLGANLNPPEKLPFWKSVRRGSFLFDYR